MMTNPKRIWLVLFAAACCLRLAPAVPARDANANVSTNNPAPGQASAGVLAPSSNASAELLTNEPAVNEDGETSYEPRQIVLMGQNAELKAGETADAVVVIGGSAKIHGKVRNAVVVIGGTLEVDGEVGDAVVAVLGNVRLGKGALVHRNAVAVLGGVAVAPGAVVEHDAVSVGGKLDIAEGAVVHGQRVNVRSPIAWPSLEWLRKWFRYCVLELRPLAPQVGWVWIIAAVFFVVYLLVAAVFPRPVQVCVDELTRRPATTFCLGLLTKLLVPVVLLLLAATGIGLIVAPFLIAAVCFGAVIGKVAILEWLGLRIGGRRGGVLQKPLVAFLIGSILLTLLYMVPILGLTAYAITSVWGLGCAVTAGFSRLRREIPDKPITPAPPFGSPPAMPAPVPFQPVTAPVFPSSDVPTPGAAPMPDLAAAQRPAPPLIVPPPGMAGVVPPLQPPLPPQLLSFPRAGFWERMAAAFLDIVIVGVLSAIVGGLPLGFIVALAYFVGMWTWKGTTIGGIILKLQVVRTDGAPLTFVVALVRGLAATLSVFVFFLGFLWIAWDNSKQGWHDKIAGTEVVRLPRATPLV